VYTIYYSSLPINSINDKKDLTVIECAIGFSVIPHPLTGVPAAIQNIQNIN
jgi:hypothetical protein